MAFLRENTAQGQDSKKDKNGPTHSCPWLLKETQHLAGLSERPRIGSDLKYGFRLVSTR